MKIILLLLAILPGIIAVFYVYWRDRYDKEPLLYIAICFGFGLLSTYPAIKMEEFGIRDLGIIHDHGNIFMTFTFAFAVIAFSEEFVKFIFLRYYMFQRECFDEPMDGIVYSVVISMGFATLENVLYVVVRSEDIEMAFQIGLLRMFTAIPAHAIFGILMGYYVGLSKFSEEKRNRYLLFGLISAVLLHGLYDFFVFMQMSTALVVFTLVGGVFTSSLFIRRHVDESPHKEEIFP